jgi:hypothetical protein
MSRYSGTAGRAGVQRLAAILAEGGIESRPSASRAFNIVSHCYIKIQSDAVDVNMRIVMVFINLFSTPCPSPSLEGLGDTPNPPAEGRIAPT